MGERSTDGTRADTRLSVLSDSLPGVTADHTETAPAVACCDDHDPVAEDIQCCDDCPDAPPMRWVDTTPTEVGVTVIDLWEINQRTLERMVAAGQPLPDGITADQVRAWRAERGPGEAFSLAPGVELVPFDTTAIAEEIGEIVAVAAEPDMERCPAACGPPADRDLADQERAGCPVHPDGAHRCYRRPGHQTDQEHETGGRLNKVDHQCDCGYIWLSLTGGTAGLDQILERSGQRGALRAVLAAFARVPHQPGNEIFTRMVKSVARELGVTL